MMKTGNYIAVLMTAFLFNTPLVAADSSCEKPGTPQEIVAKVVKVDMARKELTLQDSNGATHVMNADEDTLKRYKPGDSLTATLRCPN
jgi:hypothetical protein